MLTNLYGKETTSKMATVICGIENIHLLASRFLVLLHVESNQRFLVLVQQSVIGVTQKQLNLGKISAISSDVSEKQSIVYTSNCIESAIIEKYHSEKQLNENCLSHTRNEEDGVFDYQLEKWGVEKLFSKHSEPVKRELRSCIEYW